MLSAGGGQSPESQKWDAHAELIKHIPQAQYNRRAFDRIFYRNLLFFLGQQWIRYNRQVQQWKPVNVPDWFPKQVTNKFATACDAMKSVFAQTNPIIIYGPADDTEESVAAANVAGAVSDVIDCEVDNARLKDEVDTWLVLTGNAFVVDGYDKSETAGKEFIQHNACPACKTTSSPAESENGCAGCGGEVMPAVGQDGQPIGEDVPVGSMMSEVATPFEVHFDMQAVSIEHSQYIYRAKTYPTQVLKEMFPDKAEEIKEESYGADSGLFYNSAIAYITNATATNPGNIGGSATSIDGVKRTTLYHLWRRPCSELPNGGEALIAGDTTCWKGDLSYHDDKGKPIIPITHFQFKKVPGRVFAKTPADDLIFKQVQRNKVEALIQLAIERCSNPTWLLPKGIGIDNITGEPGEKLWYNGMLNGLKPERIGGTELPGSVFRWVEAIDKDFDDLAATYDVLKGNTPKGVPTLGGTQMLLERGLSRFGDALKNYGRGWTQVRRNRLFIWKEFAADERTRAIVGPNGSWEVQKFNNASIAGNIDIKLEEGSAQPKSKAYQQMIAGQLIQAQLLDLSDPDTRMKLLHKFDAGDLVEGLDINIKDAIKEKEEFVRSGRARPRPNIDDDAVHLEQHTKFAKCEQFFKMPQELQMEWLNHTMSHLQQIQQKQQSQAQSDPKVMAMQMQMQNDQQKAQVETEALQGKKQVELSAQDQRHQLEMGAQAQRQQMELQSQMSKHQSDIEAAHAKHKINIEALTAKTLIEIQKEKSKPKKNEGA